VRSHALDDRSTAHPTVRRLSVLLLALVATVLTTLLGTTVAAAPSHAAAVACSPDRETACINGTIRTEAGEPAVGVSLTVEGPGGTATVETDAAGRWSAPVTESGEYTVTLDVETLPAGETLRDPANNPRTVEVLLGASRAALFPLGTPSEEPAPSESADPGSTASPRPTPSTDAAGGVTFSRVLQQATNGLLFGLLLALASVGLSLIYGTTGLSNFAHGEQVTLGAILAYVGCQLLGLPLLVSGIAAVLLGAATGWLQDAGIWHQLRRRRIGNTPQLIVTIGLSIVLQYTFQFFFGGGRLRIVTENPVPVYLGPIVVTRQSIISAVIAIVTLTVVALFLLYSRTGRATRAVSDNPALAAASGIGVERIIRFVWTAGAGLAALGGVLIALYFNSTSWNMGGTILLLMFAAVTLGGLGTAWGALAGSIVIGLVAEMSSLFIPSDMRYAGALLILILVLLVRPQGILGRADRIG
jgi:branched-subunit amino acid ABC-type transport system permease component